MNNFPFPPAQPDVPNEPGISPNLFNPGNMFGDKAAIQPKRKVESISNVIINLAIPFPPETVLDDLKRTILTHAIAAEMVSLRVEMLEFYIDAAAIQLQARIPSHLCADRVISGTKTRAAYAWLVATREPLFFSGSIVSTQEISQADIALLMT